MHQAFSEMHQGKRKNATGLSHSIKIVVLSQNRTLIILRSGSCFILSQAHVLCYGIPLKQNTDAELNPGIELLQILFDRPECSIIYIMLNPAGVRGGRLIKAVPDKELPQKCVPLVNLLCAFFSGLSEFEKS